MLQVAIDSSNILVEADAVVLYVKPYAVMLLADLLDTFADVTAVKVTVGAALISIKFTEFAYAFVAADAPLSLLAQFANLK